VSEGRRRRAGQKAAAADLKNIEGEGKVETNQNEPVRERGKGGGEKRRERNGSCRGCLGEISGGTLGG